MLYNIVLVSATYQYESATGITHTIFFFFRIFVYLLCLCWIFFAAHGHSLVAASGGSLSAVGHGLLVVVTSLIAEHRF